MGRVTPELIRAQAAEMRGAELDEQRSQQLAADVGKLIEAVLAVRAKLDFNDEPAHFSARLSAVSPRKRK